VKAIFAVAAAMMVEIESRPVAAVNSGVSPQNEWLVLSRAGKVLAAVAKLAETPGSQYWVR